MRSGILWVRPKGFLQTVQLYKEPKSMYTVFLRRGVRAAYSNNVGIVPDNGWDTPRRARRPRRADSVRIRLCGADLLVRDTEGGVLYNMRYMQGRIPYPPLPDRTGWI